MSYSTTPRRPWWKGWLDALRAYRHPRVLAMLFLGFSAGLPFMLVFSTLSAWLREVGVERATIGMLSWVGIIYSIKFFWAPVVDRLPLPLLGRWLGRRRSWMLLAQAGIALGLFNIAHLDPVGPQRHDLPVERPDHIPRQRQDGGQVGRHAGEALADPDDEA